jgi:uncharacterized protein YaaN involved in tellurite resistance
MCGFTAGVVDVDSLTPTQKRALRKALRRRKKSIEELLKDTQRAMKDIDAAIYTVEKKLRKKSRR